MNKPAKGNWFYGVNTIRFVLALVVLLAHSHNAYAAALKHSAVAPLRYFGNFLTTAFDGTAAVIAFFIISGFVIHYSNKNGIPNLIEFWTRRFLRILLPLILILIAGSFCDHPESKVVWSLYCELIYYAAYPLLSLSKPGWKKLFLISYAIAAIVICSFATADIVALFKQANTTSNGNYWQLGVVLTAVVGLPCWLLGVLIAENIDQLSGVTTKTVIIYRIAVYVISVFLTIAKFHFHVSYIISMNIFALVLYLWIRTEIIYFKNHKPNLVLEKMGEFLYSLYLCHPLMYFALNLLIANTVYTYPFLILLTIATSYGFYSLVEKPSHLLARRIVQVK